MERGDDAARHPDATPTATHAGAPAVTGRAVGDGDGGAEGDIDGEVDAEYVGDCPGDGEGRTAAPCPHAARAKTAMNPSAQARLMSITSDGGAGQALAPVP
jgi:hypothetical protein